MVIVLLAIIAAALLFGAKAVGSVLGQALVLVGLGFGLVALGLLGRYLTSSGEIGVALAFASLFAFLLWAHFSTPKGFRGMNDGQIEAKLKQMRDGAPKTGGSASA